MTRDESRLLCQQLFLDEVAAGRRFYAVNQCYPVLLRRPTAADLSEGLETQEAERSRVKATQIVITRCQADGQPVILSAADGRMVTDQWASGCDKVAENFQFEQLPTEAAPVPATRKPGRPCAYVRLSQSVTTVHGRGEETWAAGSYMSCWNETTMDDFTSITEESFAAMKEPADKASAIVLKLLQGELL
jgi:hypothetical protein